MVARVAKCSSLRSAWLSSRIKFSKAVRTTLFFLPVVWTDYFIITCFTKIHCFCCRASLQWLRIGILCRLKWLTWQRSSVQQQSATILYLIFTLSFFVTQTSGLYSILNSSLLKIFYWIIIWKGCVYQLWVILKSR